MTTIPDSVKATLDAQWTAAGGAEPTYFVTEDYTTTVGDITGQDFIRIVSLSLRSKPEPVNDTYSTITHTLDIIVNTITSADRRKEIADEVERILNTVAITGVDWQKVTDRVPLQPVTLRGWHQEKLTVTIKEFMASSSSAYGGNTTANYLNSLLMYGADNAAWVPCSLYGGTNYNQSWTAILSNASNGEWGFQVPLPTTKGSLKLYVAGTVLVIGDADATNYVTQTGVYGILYTGQTSLDQDTTDKTTAARHEDTFTAIDCSGYDKIQIWLSVVSNVANALDIYGVLVKCYYA